MIEYEFVDKSGSPPGNWRIKVPQTGIEFKHYDYRAISKAYKSHCGANNIPLPPNWEEEFLSEMCKQNPHWGQKCRPAISNKVVRRRLSLTAILSFLNMMRVWAESTLSGKDAFVPQDEAERRAGICANCPFNATLQFSCGACMGAVLNLIQAVIGKRKTSLDDSLGACLVCSCSLKAAVHVPLEVQRQGLTDSLKSEFDEIKHCWKRLDK